MSAVVGGAEGGTGRVTRLPTDTSRFCKVAALTRCPITATGNKQHSQEETVGGSLDNTATNGCPCHLSPSPALHRGLQPVSRPRQGRKHLDSPFLQHGRE